MRFPKPRFSIRYLFVITFGASVGVCAWTYQPTEVIEIRTTQDSITILGKTTSIESLPEDLRRACRYRRFWRMEPEVIHEIDMDVDPIEIKRIWQIVLWEGVSYTPHICLSSQGIGSYWNGRLSAGKDIDASLVPKGGLMEDPKK